MDPKKIERAVKLFLEGIGEQPNRPGLKAAYHGQCRGCHKAMDLKKPLSTDCVGCHKEKKK